MQDQIIFFKGQWTHGLADGLVGELVAGFKALGLQPLTVDLTADDWMETFKDYMCDGRVKFVFGYNGVGIDLSVDNQSFFDVVDVPFVAWYVDHPCYHRNRLFRNINNLILTYVDQTHVEYSRQLLATPYVQGFVPLGGAQKVEVLKPYAEREKEVVFIGNYNNPEELKLAIDAFPPIIAEIAWKTIDKALFETELELSQQFFDNLKLYGMEPKALRQMDILYWLAMMDYYIRGYRRYHILSAIRSVPVQVYGSGWEDCPVDNPNIRFEGPVENVDVPALMNDAKVVLNIMPNFKAGIHDRILYALMQGALSLTDTNPWLTSQLLPEQDIATFCIDGSDVDQKLAALLADPERAEAMIGQGRQKALSAHTWVERAKIIDRLVDAHNYYKIVRTAPQPALSY